ncbi:hypothetical protein HID58_082791 [Brassica napus]|uniref:Uncharacterized protein n=1 Tax=Brassica napus TaxID=3708 RepID=A0ABQ7YBL6_BRANA|nr:hypothetical protein HID58_082791 [Brassica napus]
MVRQNVPACLDAHQPNDIVLQDHKIRVISKHVLKFVGLNLSNGCGEKKLFENNYSRAKIFINQAKSLDIDLGCLNQVLIMINFVANEETVKKLHKNSTAQRTLFKLILKVWSQLSDQEGKHKNSGIQKSQKPHEPASSNKPMPKPKPEYEPPPKFEPTFWKGCNRCKTYCEFLRADYLNKSS